VFIDADGSASIDGVPVQAASGQSLDEAVLDTLHRHARQRDSPVTAAISDPATEHVTFVEVAPDGSSRLLEEPVELSQAAPAPPSVMTKAGSPEPHEAHNQTGGAVSSGNGASFDAALDSTDDDLVDSDGLEDLDDGPDDDLVQSPPSPPPPEPSRSPLSSLSSRVASLSGPRRSRDAGVGAASRQSDDEYRAPGLLQRPLLVGPVALGVAAAVVLPLVLLGSGSGGDREHNKAAGAGDKLSGSPAHHGSPASPTVSVSPSLSPSPSASNTEKKSKPEKAHADGVETAGTVTVSPPSATVTVRPPKATATVRPPKATATVTAEPSVDTAVKRPAGKIYLFDGHDNTGDVLAVDPVDIPYIDWAWNDRASSVWNRSGGQVCIWTDADHHGYYFSIPAGAKQELLYLYDNAVSSLSVGGCGG
jgi:hypothetical protein